MSSENKSHFTLLNIDEKRSKLNQLANCGNAKATVWIKQKNNRTVITLSKFDREELSFHVHSELDSAFFNQAILYTFQVNGVQYFGECRLIQGVEPKILLSCESNLYKNEKRSNFRVLTYPHQNVYINVRMPEFDEIKNNVISFKTKQSETGLFKNFLQMIEEDGSKTGLLKLRVLDLSLTGLALRYGELEKKILEQIGNNLGEVFLQFHDQEIVIDKASIVYNVDYLSRDKKIRVYKAGIVFDKLDSNEQERLNQLVNNTLIVQTDDFEDFIK